MKHLEIFDLVIKLLISSKILFDTDPHIFCAISQKSVNKI